MRVRPQAATERICRWHTLLPLRPPGQIRRTNRRTDGRARPDRTDGRTVRPDRQAAGQPARRARASGYRVRDVERGRARLDHRVAQLDQEVRVRPPRILRTELDVVAHRARVHDGRDGALDALGARDVELVLRRAERTAREGGRVCVRECVSGCDWAHRACDRHRDRLRNQDPERQRQSKPASQPEDQN
jgi:hypothetical protein